MTRMLLTSAALLLALNSGLAQARTPGLDCVLGQVVAVSEPLADAIGGFRSVDSSGDLIAATTQAGSLVLYRVGPGNQIEQLYQSDVSLQARQVAIDGSLLCVSVGAENRIVTIDVTNPAAPVTQGELTGINLANPNVLGGLKNSMFVTGDLMCVVSANGLRVVDLSEPTDPAVIGVAAVSMNPAGVLVRDGMAYVADYSVGLRMFDVSNPSTPVQAGTTAGLSAFAVALHGEYAFLSGGIFGGSVTVIDVSAPAVPTVVRTVQVGASAGYMSTENVLLHVSLDRGVATFDLADPTDPVLLRRLDSPALTGTIDGMVLAGETVCVAGGQTLLALRGDSGVSLPAPTQYIPTPGSPLRTISSVAGHGTTMYVADRFGRKVQALDLSGTGDPVLIGEIAVGSSDLLEVEVGDSVAFVRSQSGLIYAVDVADPAQMSIIGSWTDPSQAAVLDMSVVGHVMTNAVGLGGISVLDVSSPGSPVQVASFVPAPGRRFHKVVQNGSLAAVAGYLQTPGADSDQISLIDLTSPESPSVKSAWISRSEIAAISFASSGSLLVVAESSSNESEFSTNASVAVLDVADPNGAVLADRLYFPVPSGSFWSSDLRSMAVAGDRIYVAGMLSGFMDSTAGMTVVELGSDGVLGRHASSHAPGMVNGVRVAGDRVAMASSMGLSIFDRGGCPEICTADLSEPFGVLNFFDISAYLSLYVAQDPAADLAAPFGVWNFFDLSAYMDAYNAGCP